MNTGGYKSLIISPTYAKVLTLVGMLIGHPGLLLSGRQ